jgi:DNA-binding Lrp family transcriptional regulator
VNEVDSTDRALVAALQLAPRAPIAAIAAAIDIDASTLTRRYARLTETGLLRIGAMLDWRLLSPVNPSIVWIRCKAGASEDVAAALREVPEAQSILLVTGQADVHSMVYPTSRESHRRLLTTTIPSIHGVEGISSQLILRTWRRGAQWRLTGALSESALARMRELGDLEDRGLSQLSPTELDAVRILFDEGRIGASDLSDRLSVSRSTAQRVLRDVLTSGLVSLRVEIEPSTLGLPLTAIVAIHCAPGRVEEMLDTIVGHSAARFVGMTAGSASAMFHGVFHDEESLRRFLSDDLGGVPGVDSVSVSIALATIRRNWIDLDDQGCMTQKIRPPNL